MKNPTMKITTIGFTALLGSLLGLSAIERPGGEKETRKTPPEPQGGVLGNGRKAEKADAAKNAPKPMPVEKVAYLGVGGESSSDALLMHLDLDGGLLLNTVDPASPAGLSGLKEFDIIVAVDEARLTDQDSLRAAIASAKPGDEVTLKLIRRGKAIEQKVTLGEAPAVRNIRPLAIIPNQAADMNRLLNRQLGNALGGLGDDRLQAELMDQLEKALGKDGAEFKQFRFNLGGDLLDGQEKKMGFRGIGSMRFEDGEGSIEMKMSEGQRELKIRDKEGKLLFEGPYDNEIDKAAVPEEYRERVERLDMGGKGNNFRLKLNGGDLFEKRKKEEKGE